LLFHCLNPTDGFVFLSGEVLVLGNRQCYQIGEPCELYPKENPANARFYISEGVAWQIFYAHVFSHLTYLSSIWSSAADSWLSVLRVLQNKAIKIIKNYGWRHPSLDLYNSKTLPLGVLMCDFSLLISIFKMKIGILKCNALLEKVSSLYDHNTRSSANLHLNINFARTNLGQSNVFYRGLRLYNDLPVHIKNSSSRTAFKKHIGLTLFENYAKEYMM
jgi:hypothetical protein